MNEEDRKKLQEIVKGSDEQIQNSSLFLSLLSEGWKRDPVPLLQMAIAILYDKPICLVVMKGMTVPEHLKKIATQIEYVNEDSEQKFQEAVEKIIRNMEKLELLKRSST